MLILRNQIQQHRARCQRGRCGLANDVLRVVRKPVLSFTVDPDLKLMKFLPGDTELATSSWLEKGPIGLAVWNLETGNRTR